jgi:hypothetical protein
MGKATEALDKLASQVLTAEELEERRAVAESGGAAEATEDGRLVKPALAPTAAPKVTQVPAETWD